MRTRPLISDLRIPDNRAYLVRLLYLVFIVSIGLIGRILCFLFNQYGQIHWLGVMDGWRILLTICSAVVAFCLISHNLVIKRIREIKSTRGLDFRTVRILNRAYVSLFIITLILLAFSSACLVPPNQNTILHVQLIITFFTITSIALNVWSYSHLHNQIKQFS